MQRWLLWSLILTPTLAGRNRRRFLGTANLCVLRKKYGVPHILVKEYEYADNPELLEFLETFTQEIERTRKHQVFEVNPFAESASPADVSSTHIDSR